MESLDTGITKHEVCCSEDGCYCEMEKPKHTPSHTAALAKTLNRFGLEHRNAEYLASAVLGAIDRHDPSDIQPVALDLDDITMEDMEEVDDVAGMRDALGTLATALINIEDATH